MPQAVKKKSQQPKGSNVLRWIGFIFLLLLFCGLCASLFAPSGLIEEVALSDVIARAKMATLQKLLCRAIICKLPLRGKTTTAKLREKMVPVRFMSRG